MDGVAPKIEDAKKWLPKESAIILLLVLLIIPKELQLMADENAVVG